MDAFVIEKAEHRGTADRDSGTARSVGKKRDLLQILTLIAARSSNVTFVPFGLLGVCPKISKDFLLTTHPALFQPTIAINALEFFCATLEYVRKATPAV